MASSTLNDRRCLAVIFDLDDTLVPTSQLDRAAIATAAELVESDDAAATAARFKALLKAEPFPPPGEGGGAPVLALADWRAWLWARAMAATDEAAATGAAETTA